MHSRLGIIRLQRMYQCLRCLGARLGIATGEEDVGSVMGEGGGDHEAYAAGGAGDENVFVGYVE